MPIYLWIYEIAGGTFAWYDGVDDKRLFLKVDDGTTAGELKQAVAEELGIPADMQLHGVLDFDGGGNWKCRFNTEEEILCGNDDSPIGATLTDLFKSGRITAPDRIGMVLPADVGLVREISAAEALEKQLAAGRANAIDIEDDDHGNAPQPKGKRSVKVEGEDEEARVADGGNNEEEATDHPAPVPAAAGGDAIGGAAEEAGIKAEEDAKPEEDGDVGGASEEGSINAEEDAEPEEDGDVLFVRVVVHVS